MKIAVWYHARLEGGLNPPINLDDSLPLMAEQMADLNQSGLADAADEIMLATNGGLSNQISAAALAPPRAKLLDNGVSAESLLPTFCRLREWLGAHPDWAVCFFHTKGVTHAADPIYCAWRRCMSRCVILNWRQCLKDLQSGYDSSGAHWLTPEKYPGTVKTPFWGGAFYWATAKFLLTLPPLPSAPSSREDWFLVENWIGSGPRRPHIKDYAPHWPGLGPCSKT